MLKVKTRSICSFKKEKRYTRLRITEEKGKPKTKTDSVISAEL